MQSSNTHRNPAWFQKHPTAVSRDPRSLSSKLSLTIPCFVFVKQSYGKQSQVELEHDSPKIRRRNKIVFGSHWLRNYTVEEWVSKGSKQEAKLRRVAILAQTFRKSWTKNYTVDEWISIGLEQHLLGKNRSLENATQHRKGDEGKGDAGNSTDRPQPDDRIIRGSDHGRNPAPKWSDGVYKPDDIVDYPLDERHAGGEAIGRDSETEKPSVANRAIHERTPPFDRREDDPVGHWTGRIYKPADLLETGDARALADAHHEFEMGFAIDEDLVTDATANIDDAANLDDTGRSAGSFLNLCKNFRDKTKKRGTKKQCRKTAPWEVNRPSKKERR